MRRGSKVPSSKTLWWCRPSPMHEGRKHGDGARPLCLNPSSREALMIDGTCLAVKEHVAHAQQYLRAIASRQRPAWSARLLVKIRNMHMMTGPSQVLQAMAC